MSSHADPANIEQAQRLLDQARAARQAGHLQQAVDTYQHAIATRPGLSTGYVELITMLLELGDAANAAKVLSGVPLALYQQSPPLRNLHGVVLLSLGHPAKALPILAPLVDSPGVDQGVLFNNLAACHDRLDDYAACLDFYESSLRAGNDGPDLYVNWAGSHQKLGDTASATRVYEEGLRKYPGHGELLYEYAVLLLKNGDFSGGFARYGHRWEARAFAQNRRPVLPLPCWDGRTPVRSLLVMPEQGIGDQIVFSALLPALQEKVERVSIAMAPRLLPLLQRSWPGLKAAGDVASLDAAQLAARFDAWIPAGDLGRLAPEGIGWRQGPLRADPVRVAALRETYRRRFPGKRLVGISWKSKRADFGEKKSIRLVDWQPLLAQSDCQFISLQYGEVADDLREVREQLGIEVWADPAIDSLADLDGLATQIGALDQVITTSNTTAHLAAALRAPTWVLLPVGPALLWYWGFGERSAWYPEARLFRASAVGAWGGVIADVAAALREASPPRA